MPIFAFLPLILLVLISGLCLAKVLATQNDDLHFSRCRFGK